MTKVWIAGGTGMLGSAISAEYGRDPRVDVLVTGSHQVDLLDPIATQNFIRSENPDSIILAAARVGGVGANTHSPVRYISQNLRIQSNLMQAACEASIKRLVFISSSCVYPTDAAPPFAPNLDFGSSLDKSVRPFAIAKLAGMEFVNSVRRQFGLNWINVIPSNVYGPGDNYSLSEGHVIGSLIRRFSDAAKELTPALTIWGSGKAMREFTYVEDAARAILLLEREYDSDLPVNVSSGEEISIRDLAELIKKFTRFQGELKFDSSKPEGAFRKLLDNSQLVELGWKPQTNLFKGLGSTIVHFQMARSTNPNSVRL